MRHDVFHLKKLEELLQVEHLLFAVVGPVVAI
jgi:hypothetical protein